MTTSGLLHVEGVDYEEFRRLLVAASAECDLQDGWPCGSCCYRREPEDWTAILAYRGDYDSYLKLRPDGSRVYEMAVGIVLDDNGSFVRHEFKDFLVEDLARRIQRIYRELKEASDKG
jgi:hypothetical protein